MKLSVLASHDHQVGNYLLLVIVDMVQWKRSPCYLEVVLNLTIVLLVWVPLWTWRRRELRHD